jgi:hypothetical protein
MFELYFGHELSEDQLRETCHFDDDDISIGNVSQIDFILVAEPECEDLPHSIARNIRGTQYELLHSSFNGLPCTVFIFWH